MAWYPTRDDFWGEFLRFWIHLGIFAAFATALLGGIWILGRFAAWEIEQRDGMIVILAVIAVIAVIGLPIMVLAGIIQWVGRQLERGRRRVEDR